VTELPDQQANRPRAPVTQRAPLLSAACAVIAGITVAAHLVVPAWMWGFAAVVAAAVGAVLVLRRRAPWVARSLVALAVACAAALLADTALRHVPADHVVTFSGPAPILATLRGRVVSAPFVYNPAEVVPMGYSPGDRTSFVLEAEAIRTGDTWTPVVGLVRTSVNEPLAKLPAGSRVELIGTLGRPGPAGNPGQFDSRRYARLSGQLVWFRVDVAAGVVPLPDELGPLGRTYWHLRSAIREPQVPRQHTSQLAAALVVGERHPALRSLGRLMIRAGVAHLLSISGLHLAVFLGFAFLLCRLGTLSRRASAAVVLVVLGAYVVVAEPRVPLVRSAIMAALLCVAVLRRRQHVALNALSAAAIVILLVDPLQVFQAGFQLSFLIVAALILLHTPVRNWMFGRFLRRRGLTVFRGRSRMWRWLNFQGANFAMDLVTASLVAYVAAAPLVAYHFGVFSPYAPVLSILLLPLVVAVLVPGYLSLALTSIAPNTSWWLGLWSRRAAGTMSGVVEQFDHLPAVGTALLPVGTGWVMLCYATLTAVVFRRRIPHGSLAAASLAVLLVGTTLWSQQVSPAPARAQLHLLDVGDGQCAVLRSPGGSTVLIDAGTLSPVDVTGSLLEPFLRARRMPAPATAFVSHANSDHYSALPPMIESGLLRKVYLSRFFGAKGTNPTRAAMRLLEMMREHDVEIVRVAAGSVVQLDERTRAEVLWPPANLPKKLQGAGPNDRGLVLRIVCDDKAVILPADAGPSVQRELLNRSATLRCDAMVLPHHGSHKSILLPFVKAADPQITAASTSRDVRSASGEARELMHWLRTNRLHLSTAANGWVCVEFGAGELRTDTMRR
jgi:competence protein ComEC